MCRNVFALQQNLTNIIISTDEEPFEKARKYYELLNISQEVRNIEVDFQFDKFRTGCVFGR
jgi:hypothetical protein